MPVEALRGIPWTLLTYALSRVVTVLTTLVLARLLAPADFGLFAMAVLGMELLSVFSGLWLAAALIVRPDLDRRAEGTVLSLVVAAGVLLAIVLIAVSPALAALFGEPRLTGIVALLAAVLLVSGVNWFYETLLQRELAFRRRFACLMARTLAFSAVALCLAVAGAGVWSLVAAYLAGYLASGAALLALAPYRVRPAFDRAEAGRILRNGRGFLGQDLAVFLGENADYLAVGRALGSAQLGFYVMAFRQAELPNYAIAEPVGKVTFPAFAQMHQRGEDVRAAFLRTLRLIALATVPAGVILSAAATPFAVALFGADWRPMAGPLAVLGVWAALRPLQVTMGQLLNSLGRADAYGRVSLLLLVPLVAGTFAGREPGRDHGGRLGAAGASVRDVRPARHGRRSPRADLRRNSGARRLAARRCRCRELDRHSRRRERHGVGAGGGCARGGGGGLPGHLRRDRAAARPRAAVDGAPRGGARARRRSGAACGGPSDARVRGRPRCSERWRRSSPSSRSRWSRASSCSPCRSSPRWRTSCCCCW